jgi:hypothetical protein
MPGSQLKRAERAIQTIRDQAELPPETADALQEIVDVIRSIEGRVGAGRHRTSAPHGGDGTAKQEMTIDRVVLPPRSRSRLLALASAYVVCIDGLE